MAAGADTEVVTEDTAAVEDTTITGKQRTVIVSAERASLPSCIGFFRRTPGRWMRVGRQQLHSADEDNGNHPALEAQSFPSSSL